MISVNTKHWQANIEVRILIIYMTKSVRTNMLLHTEGCIPYHTISLNVIQKGNISDTKINTKTQ